MPFSVGLLPPSTWARILIQAWALVVVRTNAEALTTEVARLRNQLGKKATSIWNMSKADLQEVARQELGMTFAQSQQETLITLREKIRRVREMTKIKEDPLADLSKGLGAMKAEDLRTEVLKRNLPVIPKATRAQMMIQIQDDVKQRNTLPSTVDPTPSMSSTTPMQTDEGYIQVETLKRQK